MRHHRLPGLDEEVDDGFEFVMADWDRDGILDLVAIQKRNTPSRTTEVRILSGASQFQLSSRPRPSPKPMTATNSAWATGTATVFSTSFFS